MCKIDFVPGFEFPFFNNWDSISFWEQRNGNVVTINSDFDNECGSQKFCPKEMQIFFSIIIFRIQYATKSMVFRPTSFFPFPICKKKVFFYYYSLHFVEGKWS